MKRALIPFFVAPSSHEMDEMKSRALLPRITSGRARADCQIVHKRFPAALLSCTSARYSSVGRLRRISYHEKGKKIESDKERTH
jgi:hypothetical protein